MSLIPLRTKNPRRLQNAKAKNQQKRRRMHRLFAKAYRYSIYCDADVYVVLRTRRNGQIFSFVSNSIEGWSPSLQELVCP